MQGEKMIYKLDEEKYWFLKENSHKIVLGNFKRGIKNFSDYAQINISYLVKGSSDYWFWRKFFNGFFKTDRCHFNFILRLINFFMIIGEEPIATNFNAIV